MGFLDFIPNTSKEIREWWRFKDDKNNQSDEINNFIITNNHSHIYDFHEKHLTIYKNGHGIITFSFLLHIIDKGRIKEIRRDLNLEDACNNFEFIALEKMRKTNIEDRFTEMGFWHESDNNIILKVIEDYKKKNNREIEDEYAKNNKKILGWYFSIDKGKISNGETYKYHYSVSLPNMFPISNGKFDEQKTFNKNYKFTSGCTYNPIARELKYIISFEKGIDLQQTPECWYYEDGERTDEDIPVNIENNVFYTKYIAECSKLGYNSDVVFNWVINP